MQSSSKGTGHAVEHAETNPMSREKPVFARQMHAVQHQVQVYKSYSQQFSITFSVAAKPQCHNRSSHEQSRVCACTCAWSRTDANHGAMPSDCRFADLNNSQQAEPSHTASPQHDYAAEACKQASAIHLCQSTLDAPCQQYRNTYGANLEVCDHAHGLPTQLTESNLKLPSNLSIFLSIRQQFWRCQAYSLSRMNANYLSTLHCGRIKNS